MTRRPTIIFLVTEDWYFVTHRLALAAAAVREGYRVIVATRVNEHAETIRRAGCEVVALKFRRAGRNPFSEVAALAEIVRLYRRIKPDIVHHVALKPVLYGSIAARIAQVPSVINAIAGLGYLFSSEGTGPRLIRPLLVRLLRLVIGKEGYQVIVQNPDDRAMVLREGLAREETVTLMAGAGVDLSQFTPRAPAGATSHIVVMATRMLWTKGVGEFVEAARQVRRQKPDVRFVLVGAPDLDNPTAIPAAQLEAWAKEGAIEWWGHRTDMPAILASAEIFCFPSAYGEGVPKVLLEAAAGGLPVVTTDAPGCREVVHDGENGILVPLRDPKAVAAAVTRLLEEPAVAQRMGRCSRRFAEERFSVQLVIDQTLALYGRIMATRGQRQLLLVVTEDWFVVSHWLPLIRGAVGAGYSVRVATRVQRHRATIEASGAEVSPIGLTRGSRNPFHELAAIAELVKLYRRQRPDIVHHVALKPVLYGSVAAFLTGRRAVVNALPGLGYTFSGRTWRVRVFRGVISAAYRLLLRRPGTIALFENPDDRALLIDAGVVTSERSALIPGAGVDLTIFRPTPEPPGPPLVTVPARLLWDKGVGEFVAAATRLRQAGSTARFALVGGEDVANPAAIAKPVLDRWRSEGNVEIWGHSENMPAVFAASAIVCLPSYREGLPKALSEAAASGRAIVATDVPGCREVVHDGVSGLLVPPRDVDALTAALTRLLTEPETRARYGAAGRDRAEARLGESLVIDTFLEIYEGLLAGKFRNPQTPLSHDRYAEIR